MIEGQELARLAGRMLQEKHGRDVVLLDVRGQSEVTDYFLLVTGMNTPHLKAMAVDAERAIRKQGGKVRHLAGTAISGWMVLDCWDVVIHLFLEEPRSLYDLEALWADAQRIQLDADNNTQMSGGNEDV